jgi:hypothetical protein
MANTDYSDFLLAVVNAEEKADFKGARKRFARLYGEWFPAYDKKDLPRQQLYYRRTRAWWTPPSGEVPLETPDEQFGLHAVIFRYKLRVIWAFAASGDTAGAERKRSHLYTESHRYGRKPSEKPTEQWRSRLVSACAWLRSGLKNLEICQNSECRTENRYFIRRWSNHKYCCARCCQRADEIRRLENRKLRPSKLPKRVLSDSGKSKIIEAQRKRWLRYRAAKGK